MAKKKKAGASPTALSPALSTGKKKAKIITSNVLKTTSPKTVVSKKNAVPGPVVLTPGKKKTKLATSIPTVLVQPSRTYKMTPMGSTSMPVSIVTQKQANSIHNTLRQPHSLHLAQATITSKTPDSYEAFHRNVVALIKKTTEPCPPRSYRELEYPKSEDYILLYEEEQHLADGIAFLAQTKTGGKFVSAVTLEQSVNPPSLTIRLASNEPPATEVRRDLKAALKVVQSYAQAGVEFENNKTQLFDQIVRLSKSRLYARVDIVLSPDKRVFKANTPRRSCSRIGFLIQKLSSTSCKSMEIESLCNQLRSLEQTFQEADSSRSKDDNSQIESLKATIRMSSELLNGSSESLEEHLKALHVPESLYSSRVVIELDKVRRYLSICEELMNFARRRRTREMFQSIHLESCEGYRATYPLGSRLTCHVHAEVQLILFYEQNVKTPPPRAIGSSKSACFLCDLFISKHGKFRISHSHNRLYEQWTIPRGPWSSPVLEQDLQKIMEKMSVELIKLRNAERRDIFQGYIGNNGPESRLHLLRLPEGVTYTPLDGSKLSSIAECDLEEAKIHCPLSTSSSTHDVLLLASDTDHESTDGESSSQLFESNQRDLNSHSALEKTSTTSDAASHSNIPKSPMFTEKIREPLISGSNTSVISIMSTTPQPIASYSVKHLPLLISINKSVVAFVLNVGNVEYIFDLGEINTGMIRVDKAMQNNGNRVDVKEISTFQETSMRDLDDLRKVEFNIHDGAVNELLVSVFWD